MSRKHDDTVQTAMIFFGLFIKLLGILGSFLLWLLRKNSADKAKAIDAREKNKHVVLDEAKEAALARVIAKLDADLMEEETSAQLEYQPSAE